MTDNQHIKKWNILPRLDEESNNALEVFSPFMRQILYNRGIRTMEEADAFLNASQDLADPFLLTDMDKAVDRLLAAVRQQERIVVYGDYDVDGVTATSFGKLALGRDTFGIGEDFDEHLLEAMANRGGGNFYYIANTGMIPTLLMEEFRDLAAVTLMDVRIELTFPAGVAHELFGEWRAESQGDKLVIFLSDLPASRTINLFLRITTPAGNDKLLITARATGLNEADQAVEVTNEVALVYAPQETVNLAEQKKDAELVKRFASVAIGHLSDEALRLEKAGRREEAGKMMDRAMAEFGGDLPNPIKLRYDNRSMELRQGLDESTRKNYNSEAYQFKRRRHADQVNGTDD